MKKVHRDGHWYLYDNGKQVAGPMSLEEAEDFAKPVKSTQKKEDKEKKKKK